MLLCTLVSLKQVRCLSLLVSISPSRRNALPSSLEPRVAWCIILLSERKLCLQKAWVSLPGLSVLLPRELVGSELHVEMQQTQHGSQF